MELSEEQQRRIEENRLAALARLHANSKGHKTNQEERLDVGKKTNFFAHQPKKNASKASSLKTRLQSVGMVAVVEGGEALMFKDLPGAYYRNRQWNLPLSSYKAFVSNNKVTEGIPENVVELLLNKREDKCEFDLQGTVPSDLLHSLFPFQVDGVQWGLAKNGRFILADDMGLGKSLQALAVASYYRHEWPLLILSPASMVATWTEQVKKWLQLNEDCIAVAYDGKAHLNGLVNLISYDLGVRLIDQIRTLNAGVIIADESHCLRNSSTKRFTVLSPILKRASRLVMLSGTPALSRPFELFTQLSMVAPSLFPRQKDYGLRYCSGRRDRFGWNFRGASNLKELGIILEETVMLRRTKAKVLSQLPRKIRQQVFVKIEEKELKELKLLLDTISNNEWLNVHNLLEEPQNRGELMTLWKRTGEAKLPAMWNYITDLLDTGDSMGEDDYEQGEEGGGQPQGRKVLLFAHHISLMDELEKRLSEAKIGFIRIDGRTPPSSRHSLCDQFQHNRKVRVAILSITAASVGLTLTAATLVVFCELFFNPGILVQAEDRAHRIGQTDSVTVHYLLARGTIDDRLWPLLLSKLNTLESVGLGENGFSGMIQIEHDQKQLKMDKYLVINN